MIISINVEKLFDKVQCLYKIRPFRKSSYRGKIPQPDKSICKKKTNKKPRSKSNAIIYLCILEQVMNKSRMPHIQHCTESSKQNYQIKKEIKGIQIVKR